MEEADLQINIGTRQQQTLDELTSMTNPFIRKNSSNTSLSTRDNQISNCQKISVSLKNFFRCHHETVNIWTHFIPVLVVLGIWIIDSPPHWLGYLSLVVPGIVFSSSVLAHTCWMTDPEHCGKIFFFLDWFSIILTIGMMEIILTYVTLDIYEKHTFSIIYYVVICVINLMIISFKFYYDFIKIDKLITYRQQHLLISIPNLVISLIIIVHGKIVDQSFLYQERFLIPFMTNDGILMFTIIFNLIGKFPESMVEYLVRKKRIQDIWLNRINLLGHSHHWWHLLSTVFLFWNYYQIRQWDDYLFK